MIIKLTNIVKPRTFIKYKFKNILLDISLKKNGYSIIAYNRTSEVEIFKRGKRDREGERKEECKEEGRSRGENFEQKTSANCE